MYFFNLDLYKIIYMSEIGYFSCSKEGFIRGLCSGCEGIVFMCWFILKVFKVS